MQTVTRKKYFLPYIPLGTLVKSNLEDNLPCITRINDKDVVLTKQDFNVKLYRKAINDAFVYVIGSIEFVNHDLEKLTQSALKIVSTPLDKLPSITSVELSDYSHLFDAFSEIYQDKITLEYEQYMEYEKYVQYEQDLLNEKSCCESCKTYNECESIKDE